MSDLLLSPQEARVIAALVEKSITTPQYYPLTVNALTAAANQKSCRSPVMNLSEGEVGSALLSLEQQKLVERDEHGGRAVKWRHRLQHQLLLKAPAMAVLATLMLRSAQTGAELRANAASLGGPDDLAGIDASLQDLADRGQPLIAALPRAPGQKEVRYAHRLCGDVAATSLEELASARSSLSAQTGGGSESLTALGERLAALEARVAELERQLGLEPGTGPGT